jgi:hypothetical protein
MLQWFIGKILKLERVPVEEHVHKDSAAEFKSYRYHGDEKGYEDTTVEINFYNDGAVSFSEEGTDKFIYLYSEQVKHLKIILGIKNFSNVKGILEHSQKLSLFKRTK